MNIFLTVILSFHQDMLGNCIIRYPNINKNELTNSYATKADLNLNLPSY